MKSQLKKTAIAAAVAMFATGSAFAQVAIGGNVDVDAKIKARVNLNYNHTDNIVHNETVNETVNDTITRNWTDNFTSNDTRNYTENINIDQSLRLAIDQSLTEKINLETDLRVTDIQTDVRTEKNEHEVRVVMDKELRLKSDIEFSGKPTISGDLQIDSAAIAIIDNRQSSSNNVGINWALSNDASISDDTASSASGNLGFNVAAGDNNVQDNAAALSAADASFAFGLADAEVFVNQSGQGNLTLNTGVTNASSISGNAFANASGNIGVNVASGNNNQQKNALAASVATSRYATSSISSNQHSSGNLTDNEGLVERYTDTVQVSLSGNALGVYVGGGAGTYEGSGNSYQSSNFYADLWEGQNHPAGPVMGHADFDIDSQGAVRNPFRDDVGGLGFDNVEAGELEFGEMGVMALGMSLAGTVSTTHWVIKDATNVASLSGSAFSGASGNIGVNLASGSGNMQANSLALAVAQPSTGGGNEGGGGEP